LRELSAFNVGYGASSSLRAARAFDTYWHAESMKTTYEGAVANVGCE
jgi:hypothetical protein